MSRPSDDDLRAALNQAGAHEFTMDALDQGDRSGYRIYDSPYDEDLHREVVLPPEMNLDETRAARSTLISQFHAQGLENERGYYLYIVPTEEE